MGVDTDASVDAGEPWAGSVFHNTELFSRQVRLRQWTEAERELPEKAATTEFFDARGNVLLLHLNGTGAVADKDTVFPDRSGAGHHATARNNDGHGLSFVAGQLQQAVQLDGVDDRLEVGPHADLDLVDTPWTVALWVRADELSETSDTLLVDHGGTDTDTPGGWTFGVTDRRRLLLAINGDVVLTDSGPVRPGLWQHLAARFDDGSGAFYLDGVRVGDFKGLDSSASARADVVRLGDGLAGRLDELAIWHRALTDDEISTLYRRQWGDFGRGQPGTVTSPVIESSAADSSPLTLAWAPLAPYGKELPDSGTSESAYSAGNASMSDIIGLWHFNGTPGAVADKTTFVDASGNGQDGLANNADNKGLLYAQGRFAEAICLDGVDDYIELPADLTAGVADFTFSAWVLWRGPIDPDAQEWQRIVDFGDGPATSSSGKYMYLTAASANWSGKGRLLLSASLTGYEDGSLLRATNILLPGAWSHVVVTLEGNTASLYLNGAIEHRTSDFPLAPKDIGATEHWIGRSHFSEDAALWACVDEVALWRRALSDDEVVALYQRGALYVGLQLRFCDESQACDNRPFVGPDETPESFFDELGNRGQGLPTFTVPTALTGAFAQHRLLLRSFDARISPTVAGVTLGRSASSGL